MSYSERYRCDVCDAEKGEGNGWFVTREVIDADDGCAILEIATFCASVEWDEHICSSQCLIARVHQFEQMLAHATQKGS